MSSHPGYYRHPAVSGDRVVFVAEDDLWVVSDEGGVARRLTSNPGIISFPVFSPDGKWIAFTGRDEGPTEIYLMEADGGVPRRLTWFGNATQVAGWSKNGKNVVAASEWRQAFGRITHLIEVPVDGSPVKTLNIGPARTVSYDAEGKGMVIGRNSSDPARWKRYRGGTAGTIWIDRNGNGEFNQLTKLEGNLASPMWIGNRIYFLSDHEGHGNLYSCTPTGRSLTRHTDHEEFYARFPSTDGRRIVYHTGADLWIFDPETGESRHLDVTIRSTRSQTARKFVPAARFLESFDLHPEGHSIASVHRGGAFTMPLWEGAPRRFGAVSRVRHRLASWLPDGRRVVAVHDEGGEESLIVFSGDEGARPKKISGDFGRTVALAVAPGDAAARGHAARPDNRQATKKKKSKKTAAKAVANLVATTNHRYELLLTNLDTGRTQVIDQSKHDRILGIAWSPDSRWLAYGLALSPRSSVIRVHDTQTSKSYDVTGSDFRDTMPAFSHDGKYLVFISWRTFDPIYDSMYFDLGFPKGSRPYLVTLKQETTSPFQAAHRSPRAPSSRDHDRFDPKRFDENGAVKVEIDFDDIQDRVVAFPVPEGRYGRILGGKGRIFFSSFPAEGSLGDSWSSTGEPSAKGKIESYDLETHKVERVMDGVTDFSVSMDLQTLGIRKGNRVRVVSVYFKEGPGTQKTDVGRENGWLDLDRVRLAVVPTDEWQQMYGEAWRLQRDHFWTSDMSGVDWQNIFRRYEALVPRVASRSEFSDLLWEMQGELGTSHCYEMGGDYRPQPNWFQGMLGADVDFNRRSGRWVVRNIPKGDSWDPKYASPLAAPGVGLSVGDEILEVGGEPVDETVSPAERLIHQAGRPVQLTIQPKGSKQIRRVNVRTMRDETPLRYRDWVESNRARVHRETKGRVGYVHVPNMGPLGYAEFHRYYSMEVERDGLIVDVRYNGGGHVSQLLLEKLLRRRIGYDVNRWGQPESYPVDAPAGPMVALTNEYAGSDGDMFSHAFKLFELGKLVGTRTWGGVVGIYPRASLVDGSITTQPEFAFWFEDVGFGVENYGTDPDIEVQIRPQDYAAGKDPQMKRAIAEIQKELRRNPPAKPDFDMRPKLKVPRLPRS